MDELFRSAPPPKTELELYRILSPTAGVRVSPLCLGAMSIGEKWNNFMGSMTKSQAFELLDAYVDMGGNFIDTASNYQFEDSEKWIGEWMAERGNRDLIVLATKFTTQYRAWEVGKGKSVNYQGNSRKTLHMSVRDSLKKLQTDYIDLLYVHWYAQLQFSPSQRGLRSLTTHRWDYTTSISELMDSLHALVESGKVLYLGISDAPAWVRKLSPYSLLNHSMSSLIHDLTGRRNRKHLRHAISQNPLLRLPRPLERHEARHRARDRAHVPALRHGAGGVGGRRGRETANESAG